MRVASVKTTLRVTESGKLSPQQPAVALHRFPGAPLYVHLNQNQHSCRSTQRRTPFTLQTGMVTVLVGVLVVRGTAEPSLPMVATVAPPPAATNASVDVLPRQGQRPLSRAIQRATEKRSAYHPNTLHL